MQNNTAKIIFGSSCYCHHLYYCYNYLYYYYLHFFPHDIMHLPVII